MVPTVTVFYAKNHDNSSNSHSPGSSKNEHYKLKIRTKPYNLSTTDTTASHSSGSSKNNLTEDPRPKIHVITQEMSTSKYFKSFEQDTRSKT